MPPMGATATAATLETMTVAPWTYELPQTGSFAENLDDYELRTAEGAHAGIVTGLVEHRGELYVLVDTARLPPVTHTRLAIRLADVAEIDHDALVVRLAVDRDHLGQAALALDPAKARHGPDAEAVRVHELPAGLTHAVTPGSEGPVESASSLVALVGATLGPYLLLVVIALWATRGLAGWEYTAFAVPTLLALVAFAVAGYRLYRAPHIGHHARTAPEHSPRGIHDAS